VTCELNRVSVTVCVSGVRDRSGLRRESTVDRLLNASIHDI